MAAKYLVRFDDICPTMNWAIWEPIEMALMEMGVKPIVSVVPDNQDPVLRVDPPSPGFWKRVRLWQSAGWSIGLHGYQHVIRPGTPGLMRIGDGGEFAGLSEPEQVAKIEAALRIFSEHDVRPDLWVAPCHSFDRTTLAVLTSRGIRVVSDGLGLFPYTDDLGVTWAPQQLWRLRRMPFGVWTACFHHNSWTPRAMVRFIKTLRRLQPEIASLPEVLEVYRGRTANAADSSIRLVLETAIRAKRTLRGVLSVAR